MFLPEVIGKLTQEDFKISFFVEGDKLRIEAEKMAHKCGCTITYNQFMEKADKIIVDMVEAMKQNVPALRGRVVRLKPNTSGLILGTGRFKKNK